MTEAQEMAAFVTARLDEREAAAKAAPGEHWQAFTEDDIAGASVYDEQWVLLYPQRYDHDEPLSADPDASGPQYIQRSRDELAAHIALNDPAATLLLVASLRAILAEQQAVRKLLDLTGGEPDGYRGWLLRQLATIFSTHPDYQESWKP